MCPWNWVELVAPPFSMPIFEQMPFEGLTPHNVVVTVRACVTMQCLNAL